MQWLRELLLEAQGSNVASRFFELRSAHRSTSAVVRSTPRYETEVVGGPA